MILDQFNIGVIKFRKNYFKINENAELEQCSFLGNCKVLNIEDDLTSIILSFDQTGHPLYFNIKFSFGAVQYEYRSWNNCLFKPIQILGN